MCVKRQTDQKRMVLEALSRLNHPSASEVWDAIRENSGSISRATVFRLLSEAAAEGKLQRLKFSSTDDRFDITLSDHSHIVCKKCGKVDDAEVPSAYGGEIPLGNYRGFTVSDFRIEFSGFCPNCIAYADGGQ